MARSTKALITRQDLIDMSEEGLVLLRQGSGIENSGNYINKILSREEIAQFAYLDGDPFDLENGTSFVFRIGEPNGESFLPIPGFVNDSVTIPKFTPDPSVGGYTTNTGTITNIFTTVPSNKNRMTHYGVDAAFHDTIVSPAVSLYSKTVYLTSDISAFGLFSGKIEIGKSGTTPTGTYTRTTTGSSNLSGNIRLGNLANFTIWTGTWNTGGYLTLEIFENSILEYSKNVYISAGNTGSITINNYKIKFGINYEFKGSSVTMTEFLGAYSNVTGQRACNSYLLNESP